MIDAPSPQQMAAYSKTAFECSPLRADRQPAVATRDQDNPIPAKVGDKSPIKHCIYIIKENRTYDQVMGDMPEGNGDAALVHFSRAGDAESSSAGASLCCSTIFTSRAR